MRTVAVVAVLNSRMEDIHAQLQRASIDETGRHEIGNDITEDAKRLITLESLAESICLSMRTFGYLLERWEATDEDYAQVDD